MKILLLSNHVLVRTNDKNDDLIIINVRRLFSIKK